MESILIHYYNSPIGELLIGTYQNKLCLCDWRYRKMRSVIDHRIKSFLSTDFKISTSGLAKATEDQLEQYFHQRRQTFDLPLLLTGSDFQIKVWESLTSIPYGKTETYLGLSKTLGNKLAIRAVANANGANALAIIVPCHRIIGSNGKLVGYAGGLKAKQHLLKLEGGLKNMQLQLF